MDVGDELTECITCFFNRGEERWEVRNFGEFGGVVDCVTSALHIKLTELSIYFAEESRGFRLLLSDGVFEKVRLIYRKFHRVFFKQSDSSIEMLQRGSIIPA